VARKEYSALLFEMRLSVECGVLIMKGFTHEGQRRVLVDSCGGAVYSVVVLYSAAYADAMVVVKGETVIGVRLL
jgi:hypothetical protein